MIRQRDIEDGYPGFIQKSFVSLVMKVEKECLGKVLDSQVFRR